MEKLNCNEILEVLKEKLENVSTFAYEDYDEEELGLGKIEEIYQHGGEGEGSNWWSVKFFKDHNVYIKVSGYYTSYNGTDFDEGWECCTEVKPQTKTITVYN